MTLRPPPSRWLAYGFAVLATLVAAGLRLPLQGLLGASLPFLTFFAAIAASAAYGGRGPGLLATALGGLLSEWFLLAPSGSFRLEGRGEAIGLLLFALVGVAISVMFEALHAARRRLELQKEELRVTLHSIGEGVVVRERAEQALKESEERFRALADNISILAWTADTLGWATWYNRRWYEYTGTTPDEMKDRGWESLQHPDHLERVSTGLAKALEAGVPWEDTFPLRGKDGEYGWFLSRAVPIRDESGRISRWFGTNTDVTERIRMEAALRENDRRKDEFLATLAHELRNPLAPIRNSLELLRQPGANPADVEEARDIMDRQIGLMVRLIDDLLDLSRITRGKLELRRDRVELASVVHQAIETIRPLVECAKHELEVELPPDPVHVDGDPMRLAQVFSNLLNNACKFTEPGGHITLKAALDGSEVVVSVGDDGMGIPPDKLQTIFEMFAQLDRTLERSQSGLGIGLTIVKRIVEMHGGSIQVHSDGPGKGTTFHVRLPVRVDAGGTGPPRKVATSAHTVGCRILVVDDNRDSADSLAMLLRLGGNEAHVAHDGSEALDTAARLRPDYILLDLGLPRINGYDVCQRIRREPWGRRVTIIALTGWGQEEDRRRSSEAGFDDHLVKPVDHGELMKLLARGGGGDPGDGIDGSGGRSRRRTRT